MRPVLHSKNFVGASINSPACLSSRHWKCKMLRLIRGEPMKLCIVDGISSLSSV